jgi:hypothetical protein
VKRIVDSNFLQCEALRAYLCKSPERYVVMTDYAFMEAYKADTLDTLYRSMEIISKYPKQGHRPERNGDRSFAKWSGCGTSKTFNRRESDQRVYRVLPALRACP